MFSEIFEYLVKVLSTLIGFSMLVASILIPIGLMSVNNNPAYLCLWILLIPICFILLIGIFHYINEWI